MLKISHMSWTHRNFKHTSDLIRLMSNRFAKLNIATKINIVSDAIVFSPVQGNKIAVSTVENKVMLKENDPRIKEIGRNYLLTKRLTKDQFDGFFNVIQGSLDELGLSAAVVLEDKKPYTLRSGKTKHSNPTQKSYPVAK